MTALRLHGGTRPGDLLIEGERFAARVGGPVKEIDLQGACVLPGFNDAHVHFPTWAAAQQQVRLEGARTVEEALDRVAAAASRMRSSPATRWLRGFGWRSGDWDPAVEPDRAMLDRAAPGVRVALMARDYHSLWLSSAALDAADGPLDVPGGVVEVDSAGEPTGVLRETAAWNFRDRWAAPTRAEYAEAMRSGLALAASRGVTAIHDKDGWLDAPGLFDEIGELAIRVWQSVPHEQMGKQRGDYVKAFMDGTVGSATARLLSGGGVSITGREEFEEVIRRATERDLPVAVHAIGDLANREALDAFEATRDVWAPRGLRQRIEHAQLLAPEDVGRFAALGVAASVQFSHAVADRDLADTAWAGMTDRAYAYRSLLDAGARLANGSDAPVEELDPLAGIAAGVLRSGDDRPAWHPEQRVTIAEAVRATCVEPAWLAGDEHERGGLEPGMYADLVVLDADPFEVEDARTINVVATMLGGRWTHGPYDV